MASRAPDASRPVFAWLSADPKGHELALRAERMVALQAALTSLSPLPGLTALELDEDGTLRVATPGAAAAAKLRQVEPRLAAELVARGWKVKRIRFRPQPIGGEPAPTFVEPRAPIPGSALAGFDALGRQVPEGRLKQALLRLGARRR